MSDYETPSQPHPPTNADGPLPLAGRASDPTKLAGAKALQATRAQALTDVRSAAGKWQAGLAGLLAVVGGLSISTLGDDIRALAPAPARGTATLVGVSLALAVAATLRSLRASGGMPRLVKTPDFLAGDLDHDDATRAATDLQWAIRLTLLAVAAYTTAVALTWFADRDPMPPTHIDLDQPVTNDDLTTRTPTDVPVAADDSDM